MKKNPSRRTFLKQSIQSSIALGALSVIPGAGIASELIQPVQFTQTPLPYTFQALEPIIDAMTMEIHYT